MMNSKYTDGQTRVLFEAGGHIFVGHVLQEYDDQDPYQWWTRLQPWCQVRVIGGEDLSAGIIDGPIRGTQAQTQLMQVCDFPLEVATAHLRFQAVAGPEWDGIIVPGGGRPEANLGLGRAELCVLAGGHIFVGLKEGQDRFYSYYSHWRQLRVVGGDNLIAGIAEAPRTGQDTPTGLMALRKDGMRHTTSHIRYRIQLSKAWEKSLEG